MAACLYTRARGMGSAAHAAHAAHAAQDLLSPPTEPAQDLRSLATELGLIVQELRRNIEASARILRARGAARGKAAGAPRAQAAGAPRGKAAGARDETRRPFLGDETLRPFPLRASTDCAAQALLSRRAALPPRPHATAPQQRLN